MRLAVTALVVSSVLIAAATSVAATVSRTSSAVTVQGSDPGLGETVEIGGDAGTLYVVSDRGVVSNDCSQVEPTRVECTPSPMFVVTLLGFGDTLTTSGLTGPYSVEARGGAGDDRLDGTANGDRLYGESGSDRLNAGEGGDLLDGGPDDDHLNDAGGPDTIVGGAGTDLWTAGSGSDVFEGGEGVDRADYSARTGALSLTLDGQGGDGEAGEGDRIGPDVEDVFGGSGPDRITGSAGPNDLRGGAGNDHLTAGSGQDRVTGGDGDDTVETRDGEYDWIDCGAGADSIRRDAGDFAANCEAELDPDQDGHDAPADCQPANPAVHPGASEVPGNPVDEDCRDGALYLRVRNPISAATVSRRRPTRVRFSTLAVLELRAGDRVEVRCRGKGCPSRRVRSYTMAAPTRRLDLVRRLFKRSHLRAGAEVEIRVTRAGEIGKVVRYRVLSSARLRRTELCLPVGAASPSPCA